MRLLEYTLQENTSLAFLLQNVMFAVSLFCILYICMFWYQAYLYQ